MAADGRAADLSTLSTIGILSSQRYPMVVRPGSLTRGDVDGTVFGDVFWRICLDLERLISRCKAC